MSKFMLCLISFMSICATFLLMLSLQKPYWDLTLNKDHGLTQTTIDLLQSMEGPINLTLISQEYERIQQVQFFLDQVAPYQEVQLSIQSHVLLPEQAKRYGFASEGLLIHWGDKVEAINLNLSILDEIQFSKALFKLMRQDDQWLSFVTGHGEPLFGEGGSQSYDMLEKALNQQGFRVQGLNLAQVGFIPDNTSVLVITSPRTEYLPKEIELIRSYLNQGKSLLWLMDFQAKPLSFLSDWLGVKALPGVIIDKKGYEMGTPHPAISIVNQYHPMIPVNQLSALPWAQALSLTSNAQSFSHYILMTSNDESWTHTGPLEGNIEFAPEHGGKPGPLNIAILLKRMVEDTEQNIIVIGNHRFATNAAIQNYGNLSLLMSLINVLASQPLLAQVQYGAPIDGLVAISPLYDRMMRYGLIILMPLILIIFDWYIAMYQPKSRFRI